MSQKINVKITSVESSIYQGKAHMLVATAVNGEIGIMANHTPYLAKLKPGNIRVIHAENDEEIFYISGGFLEVQSTQVSILADTVIRAEELDAEHALKAQQEAEKSLRERQVDKQEYAKVRSELAELTAQLRAISKLRDKRKK